MNVTRSDGGSAVGRVLTAALWVSTAAVAVAVVAGDRAAPRHSAWRDPISWFAADEAPHPTATRLAMLAVAVSLFALGGRRAAHRPRAVGVVVAFLGLVVGALALVPIECSPRIGYCEALIVNRLVGGEHLVHAVLAATAVVVLVAHAVVLAVRERAARTAALALVTVATGAAILVAPTGGRIGPLQWVLIAAGAASIRLSWATRPPDPGRSRRSSGAR